MELKSVDIAHLETSVKSDERRDGHVLDVRKTNVYAILFKMEFEPCQFPKIKRQWTDRTISVATGSDRNHALPLYEGERFQRKHDS